jgi:hypothetical protein
VIKVKGFQDYAEALADLVIRRTTVLADKYQVHDQYDGDVVAENLRGFVDNANRHASQVVENNLDNADPHMRVVEVTVACVLPRLLPVTDEFEYYTWEYDTFAEFRDEYSPEEIEAYRYLTRVFRLATTFRFVRRSAAHAFCLETANGMLTEVPASAYPANQRTSLYDTSVLGVDGPILDIPVTIKDRKFVAGRTMVLGPDDMYAAMDADSPRRDLMLAFFGLNRDVKPEDVVFTGEIRMHVGAKTEEMSFA